MSNNYQYQQQGGSGQAFRGFSDSQLQQFGGGGPQGQGQASGAAAGGQGQQQQQPKWRYASRGVPSQNTDYAEYSGYRDPRYDQMLQEQYGHKPASPLDDELARLTQARELQKAQFEQIWRQQQQTNYGQSTYNQKHIVREGVWAPQKELEMPGVPFPIHAKQWKGEEQFLMNLEVVENFLNRSRKKFYYKNPLHCQVCGCDLENSDYVDEVNKLSWPTSFIHYLGDHNNPPSKFFYNYVNKAAAAIQQQQ